ncbi:amino acid ABC transporter permease [Rummeliibacillus sp. G93]|uniref:amino acid ABC transporter permease n=1 Tax=Rummeliibacillus TaxID=648802 RepID=UPI00201C3CB4|nr:amino acid ABC transporter permease [Rummeliibacillus sp. G93]UQW97375.1 amino acid ABC transporter permease [Rummeliibacillus sp. G93]
MSLEWFIEIIVNNWPMFLRGAWMTLLIATVGTIFGALIGLIIGIIHTIPKSKSRVKRIFLKCISFILTVYVEFFRGTPMIVQAMVVYFGSDLLFHIDMDRTFAAMFIVSVNTGAYMAEIVRGGIISIDNGQFEAARAIGMNHWKTMVHVVLPQVMRNILPATSNQYIMNIKDTSVLNVIGVTELFFQTKTIAGNNFRYFESFFVACIIYLIMTIIVTQILRYFERKLAGNATYQLIDNQEMLTGQKAS